MNKILILMAAATLSISSVTLSGPPVSPLEQALLEGLKAAEDARRMYREALEGSEKRDQVFYELLGAAPSGSTGNIITNILALNKEIEGLEKEFKAVRESQSEELQQP